MEPERWAQIKQIVTACLELRPEDRKDGIQTACGGDLALMIEVESLLNSYEHLGDFLEGFDTDEAKAIGSEPETQPEELTGRRIGNYQISETIAHGGMGAVYKAVRADDQYRKQVAIKFIRAGFDTNLSCGDSRWRDKFWRISTIRTSPDCSMAAPQPRADPT